MVSARIVMTTVAERGTALHIARTLVEERLVACVNVGSPMKSFYRWKDNLEESAEYPLMMKTTVDRVEALQQRLIELHPYEVPEFVVLPIESGSDAYLAWIHESVQSSR